MINPLPSKQEPSIQESLLQLLDVDSERERLGWVVWEEEGRYPEVIDPRLN